MKKCLLCSKLFSKLEKIFDFLGFSLDCKGLNKKTSSINTRVDEISLAAPNCKCENFVMSDYSPGVVEGSENISIFIFNPYINIDKNGKVKPNVFNHINNNGRSVQREMKATDEELLLFTSKFLENGSDRAWKGVISANVGKLRSILIGENQKRALCIYDTSEKDNPAHAEIGRAYQIDETDVQELRHEMFSVFGGGTPITPNSYRNGNLLKALPESLKNR